jgi:hypothetical protein
MSSVRRVYFYLVTLITLGIFAGGVGVLLSLLFDITISGSAAIGQSNFIQQQLSLGLAMLVIGGPLWFFFWRSVRKHVNNNSAEIGATLRKFFLNFILVVSSLTAVFAAQTVLNWLMSGALQSQNSSGSLATLIVSLIIWYYHWRVSEDEGHPSPSARTLRRWYVYIVSGWGLVLLTVGLVQLVDYSVRYLPFWGNSLINGSLWDGAIQTSISSIIFGGLLWSFHWFRMSMRDADSSLRQVYIYLLAIVVSSIVGLVALTMGLYQILVWAMGAAGDISASYFQFLGWVIPTLIVTAAVWVYHQSVAQEEAAQLQERSLSSKRVHLYIMSFIGLGTLTSGLIILFGTILDLIINSLNPAIALQSGWWQQQLSLCFALLIVAVPLWMYYWNQIIRLSGRGGVMEWRARSRRIYLYVIIGASIIALAADLVNIVYQFLSGLLTGSFGLIVFQNSKWSIQSLIVAVPLLMYHWQIARKDQRRGAEAAAVRKTVTALVDHQSGDLIKRLENMIGARIRVLEYASATLDAPVFSEEDLAKVTAEIESSPTPKVMLVVQEGKILVLPYQEK